MKVGNHSWRVSTDDTLTLVLRLVAVIFHP